MEIRDRIAVITGGASGIGRGLAERVHADGARHVVVVDRDEAGAKAVAEAIGGTGAGVDVADEEAVQSLVEKVESEHGPIDVFFSNAGYVTLGGLEAPNEELQRMWEVHVLAHVYAARAMVPRMVARGEGYILSTASAAGLLAQFGSLHYTLTKHAAISLAEWIAITHGHQGIRVSVLCPQAVSTNITQNSPHRSQIDGPVRAWRAATASCNPKTWPRRSPRPWRPSDSISFPTPRYPSTSSARAPTWTAGSAACSVGREASSPRKITRPTG